VHFGGGVGWGLVNSGLRNLNGEVENGGVTQNAKCGRFGGLCGCLWFYTWLSILQLRGAERWVGSALSPQRAPRPGPGTPLCDICLRLKSRLLVSEQCCDVICY